jgi:hypothetical protein
MRKLLILSLVLHFFISNAQMQNDFAESFFYFPKNTFILIPSHAGIDSDLQANLAYRSYLGQLSAVSTYLADINYNVQKKDKSFPNYSKHIVGGGFYNEREGDFFNRQRVLLRYVWHKRLGENLHFSGGTSAHLINYVFKSSSAGSQGSAFAWSGNIGASIYNEHFRLGISVNDFNSPSIGPVDYVFVLHRYYTVHAEKSLLLNHQTKLTGSLRTNIVPQGYSTGLFHLGIYFAEKIGLNSFAHTNQGWGLALDINKIELGESWLDVSFAYKMPYAKGRGIPTNAYEINVGYYLNKILKSID